MRTLKILSASIPAILFAISIPSIVQAKPEQPAIRIVMVGDSTMASYTKPPEDRPDLTGWGQVFGDRFNSQVTILNHAKSGRSSRSFIREGLWVQALKEQPDYIFIQFGHNDGSKRGDRFTDPETSFRDYLRKYIEESRATNAEPILVTPMTRRKFHNQKIVTTLRPYAEAMLAVGIEKKVPVVDLHASSVKLHNQLGEHGSDFFNPSPTDETHFTRKGAEEICRLVAEELLLKAPELGAYLKTPPVDNVDLGTNTPVQRLRREGIRAKSRGEVDKMESAGFNLVLPWGGQLLEDATKSSPPSSETILHTTDFAEEAVNELREWAIQSKKHNQILMHMIYVGGDSTVRFLAGIEGNSRKYVQSGEGAKQIWPAHQYRHVVDWNGNAARWAPCPLEQRYWMGFVRPQLELVARTLNETGATGGAALELETYCFYSIYPGMSSQKTSFCYCDHCFGEFKKKLDSESQHTEVQVNQRFDWLTQRGLLPRYEQFLEDHLASLIQEMMLKVRKIDPDFLFGFYPYSPFWYYDGLIRGAGSDELPCLLFPAAEYDGGFTADPPYSFFGDVSTSASVEHIQRRKLPAMYAGGLWAKAMKSPDALATAMDRMLRGADGYWVYDRVSDPFWKQAAKMNQWSSDNPTLPTRKEIVLNPIPEAISHYAQNPQEGISVDSNRIAARFNGPGDAIRLFAHEANSEVDYHENWQSRGELPALDNSDFHSNQPSIRFEPLSSGDMPRSPFIDYKVREQQAEKQQKYELSFWTKCRGDEPARFWVGQANSKQHPAYMYYRNFMLQPGEGWKQQRIGVRYKENPPLVLRFWAPPTNGTVWLDDITLSPTQPTSIDIPLTPPPAAGGWSTVKWKLTPENTRFEAAILDPEDNHQLRSRLYNGDSLASLNAIVDLKPLLLRLQVFPTKEEPVILEQVQIGFIPKER